MRAALGVVLARIEAVAKSDPVILIDGASGAGKTTLATALAAAWTGPLEPVVVRMDDMYPGWRGLHAASAALGRELIRPLHETGHGRWRRYDWQSARAAEWHSVSDGRPLIVEGCGTITRETCLLADLSIWLDAADDVRKRRALERDNGAFDANWNTWQEQFDRHVTEQNPRSRAGLVLATTTSTVERRAEDAGGRYGRDMSENREDVEYIVEYIDGPLEGESDRRVLVHGEHDEALSTVAAVDGLESLFRYNAVDTREIAGELHVRYRFDAPDSDPVESDADGENRDGSRI